MQGKIIRGVGGFYYVHVPSIGLLECKAKGAFRNRRVKPLVGDNVDVTILDEANALGNIEEILPRHSELIRPAVANVDQAIVIFAASYPKPNINLLDRFLLMMQSIDRELISLIRCLVCPHIAPNFIALTALSIQIAYRQIPLRRRMA